MKLTPRLALRLEPCEIDALEFNQCWTKAVRRMEEDRRGGLTGPAEHEEPSPSPRRLVAVRPLRDCQSLGGPKRPGRVMRG